MKTGFILWGGEGTASSRLRGYNLVKELDGACLYDGSKCDALVFQKAFSCADLSLAKSQKLKGIKIVFDICDNYLEDPNKRPRLIEMCGLADVVTTVSPKMAEVYRAIADKVVVIEDGVKFVSGYKKHGDGGRIKALWYGNCGEKVGGSERGMGDLVNISASLNDVGYDLCVVSNSKHKFERIVKPAIPRSRYVDWTLSAMEAEFLRADVVVIPVVLDQFSIGKSSNRVLEGMLRGLPVVASPVPSYREVIKDGVDGFMVHSWDYTEVLGSLRDFKRRAEMGARARAKVVGSHLISGVAQKWIELLRGLL